LRHLVEAEVKSANEELDDEDHRQLPYIAPELLRDPRAIKSQAGPMADIWSLGCVLARMARAEPLEVPQSTLRPIPPLDDLRELCEVGDVPESVLKLAVSCTATRSFTRKTAPLCARSLAEAEREVANGKGEAVDDKDETHERATRVSQSNSRKSKIVQMQAAAVPRRLPAPSMHAGDPEPTTSPTQSGVSSTGTSYDVTHDTDSPTASPAPRLSPRSGSKARACRGTITPLTASSGDGAPSGPHVSFAPALGAAAAVKRQTERKKSSMPCSTAWADKRAKQPPRSSRAHENERADLTVTGNARVRI